MHIINFNLENKLLQKIKIFFAGKSDKHTFSSNIQKHIIRVLYHVNTFLIHQQV